MLHKIWIIIVGLASVFFKSKGAGDSVHLVVASGLRIQDCFASELDPFSVMRVDGPSMSLLKNYLTFYREVQNNFLIETKVNWDLSTGNQSSLMDFADYIGAHKQSLQNNFKNYLEIRLEQSGRGVGMHQFIVGFSADPSINRFDHHIPFEMDRTVRIFLNYLAETHSMVKSGEGILFIKSVNSNIILELKELYNNNLIREPGHLEDYPYFNSSNKIYFEPDVPLNLKHKSVNIDPCNFDSINTKNILHNNNAEGGSVFTYFLVIGAIVIGGCLLYNNRQILQEFKSNLLTDNFSQLKNPSSTLIENGVEISNFTSSFGEYF